MHPYLTERVLACSAVLEPLGRIAGLHHERLDADCVAAVVEVAGQPRTRRRRPWPAGLSDRELEAVRLLAAGLPNREIAAELAISRRTAEHHVQHVHAKIGRSTRAAATLFAMEHDLLRE